MLESRQKIEISLKTVAGLEHKKLTPNIRQTIENEYAIKYLERIGVQPTKEKIEYMLSNMPIDRALVVPVWTRSALVLVPERIEETDVNVIKQIYTGSKDIEISKRKGGSFFGKGVSEPGTNLRELKRSNTASSSKSRRKSSNSILYVEITYPYPTKLPLSEIKSINFQQLIKPLAVSDSRLKMSIKSFCSSLSDYVPRIFDDTTGKMNVIIQKFLGCLLCRRLFGLLCHYAFWNIVHPFARHCLLTAKNQHIDAFKVSNQQRTEQLDLATSSFARRKSMMTFTASNPDTLKKIVTMTAPSTEITPKTIIKGGLILNRAVGMINANRALNGFGVNALESTLQNASSQIQTRSHHVAFQSDNKNNKNMNHHENDLQTTSTNSALITLSSDASLTSEEKEMLYCQLEECLNKLHTQMGFNRQALINARQGLVTGCHFIVNEILCAHYQWLGGKRDIIDVNNNPGILSDHLSPSSRPNSSGNFDELTDSDFALIDALREDILKQINETLTDLLDPARVYCDKIMKEMFREDENTPKEIIDEKKKIQKQSQTLLLHQSQLNHSNDGFNIQHQNQHHKGKQNKYYATSIAVRAVFSGETNPETRKFLGMNSSAPYPLIQGKSKRKEKGDSIDAEPSQISNLTPLTSSVSSLKKRDHRFRNFDDDYDDDYDDYNDYKNNNNNNNNNNGDEGSLTHSPNEYSSPFSPHQRPSTMKDFKTLFEHDLKEHPKSLTPKFNPKNSLLYRRSTKIEKSMNNHENDINDAPNLNRGLSGGLSRGLSRSLSKQLSSQNLTKQFSENLDFNEDNSTTNESDIKQTLTKEQLKQQQQISVNTKSKLMSLVVQRSKTKYTDKHLLQYARIPNAKYREELLQSGC